MQGVVTVSVLYNLWAVVFRTAFKEDIAAHWHWFLLFDWIADVIYLADIAVQFHVGYLEQGILVLSDNDWSLNMLNFCIVEMHLSIH